MSTPTPRTDRATYPGVIRNGTMREDAVYANFARKLETELTAALDRIAELEKRLEKLSNDSTAAFGARDDANSRRTHAENALLDEKKLRELDSRKLAFLTRQLASAREDSARLDWLEHASLDDQEKLQWNLLGSDLRSAIDSARGVTSPPAVAETGEKEAWLPIETAPKDGKFLGGWWSDEEDEPEWMQCVCRLGKSGMPLSIVGLYSIPQVTHWQPLPPPPQGKERE